MFASQSRSRIIHLRSKLTSTRKGDTSAAVYFSKMKGFADEMATAGKQLDDDDLVSYILTGLDDEYNPLIEAVSARIDPISLSDLYAQLLSTEARLEVQSSQFHMTANSASRGGRNSFRGHGGCGHSDGSLGQGGRDYYNNNNATSNSKPICQLCSKVGHTVHHCWRKFDTSFTGEEKTMNITVNS